MEKTTVEGIADSIAESIAKEQIQRDQKAIARTVVTAFWSRIDGLNQSMKTLQDRAEDAQRDAQKFREQNVKLVDRNNKLQAAYRVIDQQIKSVEESALTQ